MKTLLTNKYLIIAARVILALVFIMAGMEKVSNPDSFAQAVENYRIFPTFSVNIIALIMPWFELICGILLLFDVYTKETDFLIVITLIAFEFMILLAMVRGLNIDCGCFGTLTAQKIGFQKLMENLLLIGLGLYIYKFGTKPKV